jgi:hypothetical protein
MKRRNGDEEKIKVFSRSDISYIKHDEDASYALAKDGSIRICLRPDGVWRVVGFIREGKDHEKIFVRKDKPFENQQANLEKSFCIPEAVLEILESQSVKKVRFTHNEKNYEFTIEELKNNGKSLKFGKLERKFFVPIKDETVETTSITL